ncbi:MAG TPA: 5-deoxy-glucuronate isomerase [Thermoanaerobaculia bacterium]|nr:5-deoxy-glucuronate isomerase [Thermoanaerobaculia bacterium]
MSLAETLHRVPRTNGLVALERRGPDARELSSWRLRLGVGDTASFELAEEETVVVLQRGVGTWTVGERSWPVDREDVFAEPATALLLPPGNRLDVTATRELEAILISAPSPPDPEAEPVLIAPSDVEVLDRGRDGFRREIHNLFVSDPHGRRLLVGETFNPAGCWSSFPPHKHDGKNGEPTLEEVYHYRIDPPQGFGHQMLYTRQDAHGWVEEVSHVVRDGDAVLIPYGYHPVSAPPGYRLYYLWALAGEERRLALFEDPDHAWVGERLGA